MESGMGRDTGGGEVHSHLSTHPHGERGTGAHSETGESASGAGGMMGQARDQAGEMMDSARDQASEVMDSARSSMGDVRGQAEEMAGIARNRVEGMMDQARSRGGEMLGQARERAGEMVDRAESTLEERTGVIGRARDNPLPALGLAFAAGFLLAGSGEKRGRRSKGVMNKAMHQLTGAVMGGVSAAIAQELHGMVGQGGGLAEMLQSYLGGKPGGDSGSPANRSQGAQSQDAPRAGI